MIPAYDLLFVRNSAYWNNPFSLGGYVDVIVDGFDWGLLWIRQRS